MGKEAELTRAEEPVRREQQLMRQLVHIGTCKGPLGFFLPYNKAHISRVGRQFEV